MFFIEPIATSITAATSLINLSSKIIEVRKQTSYAWLEGKRSKVQMAKSTDEVKQVYEEVVAQFAQANAEFEMIAREYKDMYEQVSINDEDIEFLYKTLSDLIDFFAKEDPQQAESLKSIVRLINKDMLKTMQLLGFNYREAIGVPLTNACAEFITKKLTSTTNNGAIKNKGNKR